MASRPQLAGASDGCSTTCPNFCPQSRVHTAHSNTISCVKFSPSSGAFLATASADKTVKVWRSDTRELVQTLEGHSQGISDVAWTTAENYLCTASDDHTLKLWDAQTGRCLRTLTGHTNFVFCCCFSPQGHLVVGALIPVRCES